MAFITATVEKIKGQKAGITFAQKVNDTGSDEIYVKKIATGSLFQGTGSEEGFTVGKINADLVQYRASRSRNSLN